MTPEDLDELEKLLAEATAPDPPCTCEQHARWQIHGMACAVSAAHTRQVDVEDDLADRLRERAAELLRLAGRGLKAKREVCGTCAYWLAGPEPNDGHPELRAHHPESSRGWCAANDLGSNEDDYCSHWRTKEAK